MPLVTIRALPTETGKIIQGDGWFGVADAGALVTAGTDQLDTEQLFRFVVPAAVRRANYLAIVAPCIGERSLVSGIFGIKTQAMRFGCKMAANEGLLSLS